MTAIVRKQTDEYRTAATGLPFMSVRDRATGHLKYVYACGVSIMAEHSHAEPVLDPAHFHKWIDPDATTAYAELKSKDPLSFKRLVEQSRAVFEPAFAELLSMQGNMK